MLGTCMYMQVCGENPLVLVAAAPKPYKLAH